MEGDSSTPSSSSEDEYAREPDVKVSEETLKGPSHPEPREEYNFEKAIDGRPVDQPNRQSMLLLSFFIRYLYTSFSLFMGILGIYYSCVRSLTGFYSIIEDYGNTMSSKEHHQGANPRKAISKMRERLRASGRTLKAGNHLHSQNK